MNHSIGRITLVALMLTAVFSRHSAQAQPAAAEEARAIEGSLAELRAAIKDLAADPRTEEHLPDVEIYAKAAEWILRHNEFYKPEYAAHTSAALKSGLSRAKQLVDGDANWGTSPGRWILGYRSAIDESIQPYAVSLPSGFAAELEARWPLHIVLHGRGDTLNEVSFIRAHDGKPPAPDQDWIQLDVFGRTNNAYRFAGEADVFETLADVRHRFRIDDRRIVLHGFSMGGAGSWHLGLHYPSLWCSVGPGAGFVNFYKYQKIDPPLPFYQDRALSIYNPIDYALNAFNVPICTYGGENDPQLAASTEMVERAARLGITIKLLIGPGMGHAFDPASQKEFMAFHREHQKPGRAVYPGTRTVKFTTSTLKYNTCEWVTIEEMGELYKPALVEASVDEAKDILRVKTENVAVLQLGRDLADDVEITATGFPWHRPPKDCFPVCTSRTQGRAGA